MKRLLAYLKPYKAAMVLVTLLVLFITALELYKPIIIGDAIDNYIGGYNIPYTEAEEGTSGAVFYDGIWLKKTNELNEESSYYQIFLYDDKYYLLEDVDQSVCAEVKEADGVRLLNLTKEAQIGRAHV